MMASDTALQDPTPGRAWYTSIGEDPNGDVKCLQVDIDGKLIVTGGGSSSSAPENTSTSILPSGARSTTQTQTDQVNTSYRGLHLIIDVTNAGTGSITPKIQGKDANGVYYDLLVGAAISSTGTNVLKIYPGITPVTNGTANDILPYGYRIVITANNANSMTYSAAAQLII